jgi:hypothetical protein
VQSIPTQHHLRSELLWELLESNHRFDLRMLDRDLVPSLTDASREELLSMWDASGDSIDVWCPVWSSTSTSVWGPPIDLNTAAARWIKLVARWPDCPKRLRDASVGIRDAASEDYLRMALELYVTVFTSKYSRLPTPPPCNLGA